MTARCFAVLCAVVILLATLTGCSTTPNPPAGGQPKEAAAPPAASKEPTLYTAKQCFSSMVGLAQRWQPDALPFHMESELNAEATGQGGKATVWRGFFGSRSRRTMKTFACSGSYLPSSPARGFTDTIEAPYAPTVPGLMFLPSYFVVDSDKAFAATLDHGGSALIQKDPKQPIIYSLDWDPKRKELVWLLIYGKSGTDREGIGVVSAKTGAFLSAAK
jgi:hypothetical protein